jgi:exodeoxyribonuclease VII large subunit
VRDKQAVVEQVAALRARLERAARRPLRDLERRVDDALARLLHAARGRRARAAHRAEVLAARLRAASPFARLAEGRRRLERIQARLRHAIARHLGGARHRMAHALGRLDSLSPLAVLGRGYSLTRTPDGRVVRAARDVAVGDAVHVLLGEGRLDCRVEHTRERDDRPQV